MGCSGLVQTVSVYPRAILSRTLYNNRMNLEQILEHATRIAQETGQLLREGFRQAKQIDRKSSAIDLVTQYDTEAEAFITGELQRLFPEHELFGEEGAYSGEPDRGYSWYIDPIDGTNNFAHGIPIFSVSLALYHDSRPLLGLVYDPMRGECFQAIKGQGAYLGDGQSRQRLSVSKNDSLLTSLLSTGFPYDRHHSRRNNLAQLEAFLMRAQGVRRMGSAAIDLAYVAAGRLDAHWELKLSGWDIAAGVLLVAEAGGTVTTVDGHPLTVTYTDDLNIVASNGLIHKEILDVLEGIRRPTALSHEGA